MMVDRKKRVRGDFYLGTRSIQKKDTGNAIVKKGDGGAENHRTEGRRGPKKKGGDPSKRIDAGAARKGAGSWAFLPKAESKLTLW